MIIGIYRWRQRIFLRQYGRIGSGFFRPEKFFYQRRIVPDKIVGRMLIDDAGMDQDNCGKKYDAKNDSNNAHSDPGTNLKSFPVAIVYPWHNIKGLIDYYP
jgi:hypothetical protein